MKFFVVCPPGLETIAAWECRFYWFKLHGDPLEVKTVKGGLEVEAPIEFALLNRYVKTPSRILLRWKKFLAKDYEVLKSELSQSLPIGAPKGETKYSISCSQSKLMHTKKIEQAAIEAGVGRAVTVFIRIVDDWAQLSLDTSGEHLHRRGRRQHIGKAPLRENLAAGLLLSELLDEPLVESRKVRWLDPMMGSGTFLLEACELFSRVEREFACERWVELADPALSSFSTSVVEKPDWSYAGFDVDESEVAAAKANWGQDNRSPGVCEMKMQDLFAETGGDSAGFVGEAAEELSGSLPEPFVGGQDRADDDRPVWIVSNLPYGQRVKQGPADPVLRMVEKHQPDGIAVLLPRVAKAMKISGYRLRVLRNLEDGGVPVSWVSYRKIQSANGEGRKVRPKRKRRAGKGSPGRSK